MAAQPHDAVDVPQPSPNLEELFELFNETMRASPSPTAAESKTPAASPANSPEPQLNFDFPLGVTEAEREEMSERLRLLLLDLLKLENDTNPTAPDQSTLWLRLKQLEQEVHDATALGRILSPILIRLIAHQAHRAPDQLAQALALVADRMIHLQVQQDPAAMSRALATTIPGAISRQLGDQPEEVVEAIAPAMSQAITAQIRLNPDSMVDALYPVIGSTISKYMGEIAQQINHSIEETLSPKRFVQRLWLRWQGISEVDQVLKDAVPFRVQAAFLIHKASGLVMAEVQQTDGQLLEGDLLAGMLTAIRSFASECTTDESHRSELTKIDYDNFQIVMEVAGSCYIAAVIQGDPPADFLQQLRQVLSAMILNHGYGTRLEAYNGDPDTVPESIHDLLTTLVYTPGTTAASPPVRLLSKGALRQLLGVLTVISLLLGGAIAWQIWEHLLERRVQQAIRDTPMLAVYRLNADVHWRQVVLRGAVPSPSLKSQAGKLVAEIAPGYYILKNQVETPAALLPPEMIADHAQRIAADWSERLQAEIVTDYDAETQGLTVQLPALEETQRQAVIAALRKITEIDVLLIETVTAVQPWGERIYFNRDEVAILASERQHLDDLADYLQAHPDLKLRIIGHTDQSGERPYNQQLAQQRADAVQQLLVQEHNLDAQRLLTQGDIDFPPGVGIDDLMSESRCVRFELVNTEREESAP
ncbi:MAG: OmpA family protein [Spirulinaceae cyanobacterium]